MHYFQKIMTAVLCLALLGSPDFVAAMGQPLTAVRSNALTRIASYPSPFESQALSAACLTNFKPALDSAGTVRLDRWEMRFRRLGIWTYTAEKKARRKTEGRASYHSSGNSSGLRPVGWQWTAAGVVLSLLLGHLFMEVWAEFAAAAFIAPSVIYALSRGLLMRPSPIQWNEKILADTWLSIADYAKRCGVEKFEIALVSDDKITEGPMEFHRESGQIRIRYSAALQWRTPFGRWLLQQGLAHELGEREAALRHVPTPAEARGLRGFFWNSHLYANMSAVCFLLGLRRPTPCAHVLLALPRLCCAAHNRGYVA